MGARKKKPLFGGGTSEEKAAHKDGTVILGIDHRGTIETVVGRNRGVSLYKNPIARHESR